MRLTTCVLFLVVFSAGCVTQRDKVAVVRGVKFAAAEGSALGLAVSAELGQVAADIGADAIDPATVPLTVEASRENAGGIAAERETRQWFKDAAVGLLDYAKSAWPPLGVAAGLAGAAFALWRRLGTAQNAVGAAVTITQRVKEVLADGKLTLSDFKGIYADAQKDGPAFVAGAAELKAIYDQTKAEWQADGTPIKSV